MANRNNHYERALAVHLRSMRRACIPVDESRRPWLDGESLKSLDFIVAADAGRLLLIDVKGRKLSRRRATRETWATRDDVQSLRRWERRFGPSAVALLVFVYLMDDESRAGAFVDLVQSENRTYGVLAVALRDYEARMRVRSPRWSTVWLARSDFAEVARPLSHWLDFAPRPPSPTGRAAASGVGG
jgi:hypothetical protein